MRRFGVIHQVQRRYVQVHTRDPIVFRRNASSAVRIIEVGPRDGIQNIATPVSTTTKVELINRLCETGLTNIEATSFVSPKWVPQLADGKDVLDQISHLRGRPSLRFSVLTPNLKGFENAINSGANEMVVFASATQAFSKKNQNCTVEQALTGARAVVEQAKAQDLWVRGVVSCIFSDPYSGPTDPKEVVYVVKELLNMGCDEVGLGDTLGVGTPKMTRGLLTQLLKDVPADKLTGHFHDTYGQAIANVMAAYDMGIRSFDSSIAGLGGCPFAPGAKGNAATEDLVYSLENSGISTGINLDKLASVGDWISQQLKLPNNSRAGAAIVAKQRQAAERSPTSESKSEKSIVSSHNTERVWTVQTEHAGYNVSRAGNTVKITLTRPKNGNAMTTEMLESLTRLFEDFASDKLVFQIVLAAEGRFFCTGMDLTGDSRDNSGDYHDKIVRLFRAIDDAPQTTIAAIHGPCFGGGVGLGFVCDVRLVSEAARWTLSEIKLGMSPAIISKYMAREWSIPFCREAMLSGREIKPQELQRLGAVHGIASNERELETLVEAYLDRLSFCAPRAAATCKQLMRNCSTEAGTTSQDDFVRTTFDKMLAPGSEGQYGIKKFQQRIRNVDWSQFWASHETKL